MVWEAAEELHYFLRYQCFSWEQNQAFGPQGSRRKRFDQLNLTALRSRILRKRGFLG